MERFVLTQEQLIEEASRCIDAQVFTKKCWHENSFRDYLRMSRKGASFALTRKQKADVAAQIHDWIHAPINHPHCTSVDAYDVEGRILSAWEAKYGEYYD